MGQSIRLAYFSPLNPQQSGISDYSEELLPYLAQNANVTLFVDGFKPGNQKLLNDFKWHDYRKQPSLLDTLREYDVIIYHIGNDHRYHSGIFDAMSTHPGIAVFHDFALQDFFLGLARERRDLRLYLDEMASCHGDMERQLAAEYLQRGSEPPHACSPLSFPLNCRLARSASGIIAHSEWSRSRLEEIAPGVPNTKINMPIDSRRFSERKRDKPGRVSIASFGLVIPGKGIERIIKALSLLRHDYDFHYTLVGGENPYFNVRSIIDAHTMQDRVTITGHIPLAEFERHMSETDLAINLRERTVGETSASLCRLMAASIATVVCDVGWYSELPDNAVVKIPLDSSTDAMLLAYLRRLIDDASLRDRIGVNARHYIFNEHAIERVADEYLNFVEQVLAAKARRTLIAGVAHELSALGLHGQEQSRLMKSIAVDIAAISHFKPNQTLGSSRDLQPANDATQNQNGKPGRLPRIEDIDYKHAAREYLGKLSDERQHHLRTKPFYNLAHKPAKYKNPGMDEDMHRHFCDFANIAVQLALPPGSRILDVGCGSGWLSEYFARLGYIVRGIDISPALIAMSRERVERVPYGVDHETPLHCTFEIHDIEVEPLAEKFDAIVCYDSLHHFPDEHSVIRNLAQMLPIGGQLFILEGKRPAEGSSSEKELFDVMREFQTLESPFDDEYLRSLLDKNGLAIVGDYVSVNGLFEREMLEGDRLPLTTVATNYHYFKCQKVCEDRPASTVPTSRRPSTLSARLFLSEPAANQTSPGSSLVLPITIENTGDTLWLTGQSGQFGIVSPAVRVFDESGTLIHEFHGEPPLPQAVAPGQTIQVKIEYTAPERTGQYKIIVDLINQHICWFEQRGSKPLVFYFEVLAEVEGPPS